MRPSMPESLKEGRRGAGHCCGCTDCAVWAFGSLQAASKHKASAAPLRTPNRPTIFT